MTKTVIGTYSTLETALAVVNDLVNAGFHRNTISVIADDPDQKYAAYVDRDTSAEGTAAGAGIGAMIGGLGGLLLGLGALAIPGIGPVIAAGPIVSTLAGAGVGAVTGGIIGALVDMGVPKESAEAYAESVRRGNALVAAQVPDNQAGEATRIMQRQGLVDIERQSQDWRSSGWKGFDANAAPLRRTTTNAPTNANATRNTTVSNTSPTAGTFQVVEENLQVGKRAVETGGVRVKSNVQEVPVQEDVTLRQEHVEVERRPVDRPATAADLNSFKEGTLEVRETQERPVVSKEARVVEEVRVTKNVEQHTETVHDTVRRTDVDVEPMAGTARPLRQVQLHLDPTRRTIRTSALIIKALTQASAAMTASSLLIAMGIPWRRTSVMQDAIGVMLSLRRARRGILRTKTLGKTLRMLSSILGIRCAVEFSQHFPI